MLDNLAFSGPSAQSQSQSCALCTTPSRYKCPRCATPTCSLPCSRRHKEDTRCTGERDKACYVPMNAYEWGIMMRDYCYLEEVGRKVSEWGSEIVRGGYMENVGRNKTASARKPSNERKLTTGKSRRHVLRAHLEVLGIDLELLPAGMERRNLNQSTFEQKSKRSLLTFEFVFYPPVTLAFTSSSPPSSYKMLSHRNSLSTTLLTVLQRQVSLTLSRSQKQREKIPEWVLSLVTAHPEASEQFVPPRCYIRANIEFPHIPNSAYYHKLEPTLHLSELLQGTSFVEFPTIHVFDPEASSFCGTVVDKSGSIVRVPEDDQVNVSRAVKQRNLDTTMGLKAICSLIGGYESENSSHSEEEATDKHPTALATLNAYSGSDNDVALPDIGVEENQSLDSDDDVSIEGSKVDPAKLLELVKQAQSAADEDMLDWGDEWDVDAEDMSDSEHW